jgi:thiosulfate/3-mercaptopyruvate sulfurtransferase
MKQFNFFLLFSLFVFASMLTVSSCKDKDDDNNNNTTVTGDVASCEGCHTNYTHLQEVFSPDTTVTAGGCGGDAPHYEPYDRVYMGGDGYAAFQESDHYAMGCVACHNGVDNTADKDEAHSGDFIAHPSDVAAEKCGTCHNNTVARFETSIHNGTGQMRKVAMRNGGSSYEDFADLPQHQREGYSQNCATCHADCGTCHVVRPPIKGGGLADGHNFIKTPDMLNVCVGCHTSRGGHAYLGVATGTVPDVHLTNNDFDCLDCHSGSEMHGDGTMVEQRYAYSRLPKCENCHSGINTANDYHSAHYDDFNCQVCHSQDYNNCGSCHVHGEGARIPAYQGFKIAVNPLPLIKPDYDLALVRRAPAAPDSWQEYGVSESSTFAALPTYNYTTPHNILKWTSRTQVEEGQTCAYNCHIRNEGGTLVNKEYYLFEEDLLDWEVAATQSITVDNVLPAGWFVEKN